jgi:hypothetical protein
MWKCADPELERQICCFPYGERSDVPRLQQVKQKAVGRQRNLGLTGNVPLVVWLDNLAMIFMHVHLYICFIYVQMSFIQFFLS